MKVKRTVYYKDERTDDFAGNNIRDKKIGDDFVYVSDSPLWKAASFFFYRLIATPVAWFTCRVIYGVKIKNRKALRLQKSGCFLYANHTHGAHDAFEPSILTFPKKCFVITSPEAVSVRGIGWLVKMMGAIPTPSTLRAAQNFKNAVDRRISEESAVMIYPEAHIWPYYTGVRNFPDDSFIYPVRLNAPVFACAVKHRERKIFRNLPPLITVTVSEPMYPDTSLLPREARAELRLRVYNFLRDNVCVSDNAEYIRYEKAQ